MKIEFWASTDKVGSEGSACIDVCDEDLQYYMDGGDSELYAFLDDILREEIYQIIDSGYRFPDGEEITAESILERMKGDAE